MPQGSTGDPWGIPRVSPGGSLGHSPKDPRRFPEKNQEFAAESARSTYGGVYFEQLHKPTHRENDAEVPLLGLSKFAWAGYCQILDE